MGATLVQLQHALGNTITLLHAKPRWTKDPFPLEDTYKRASVKAAGPTYGSSANNALSAASSSALLPTPQSTSKPRLASSAIVQDVSSLARSLSTPRRFSRTSTTTLTFLRAASSPLELLQAAPDLYVTQSPEERNRLLKKTLL